MGVRKPPYSPEEIASYFLNKPTAITPMKLQKLVYYAHGLYLAITGKPLINESIEAWDYGPVIKSLYYAYKKFGGAPIDERIDKFDPPTNDQYVERVLALTWNIYGRFNALELSNMTHNNGSPWSEARRECKCHIDDSIIKKHFDTLLKKSIDEE